MKLLKKLLLWTVVAFLIYAVFRYPSLAADAIHSLWAAIVHLFQSLGSFFNSLLTR